MTDAPEWMRDLVRAVPDKTIRDLVEDFRRGPPPPGPVLPTANPVDAAPVKTGSDVVAGGGTGWAESPSVNNWKPPGLEAMDRLMDAQDAMDRIERIRNLRDAVGSLVEKEERKDKELK